jgi:MGT family glycosyltransferase
MKFLFCTLGSYGFIYPAIGIAKALKNKGHEVVFVTHLNFIETIEKAGFTRIKRNETDKPSFQVKLWAEPHAVGIQVKHIEYALQQFQADILVGNQLTLGSIIAGEIYNLPVAIIGLAAYLFPTSEILFQKSPRSEAETRIIWRYQTMMGHYYQSRKLLGLPVIHKNFADHPLLGDLCLLQTIPELETEVNHLPQKVHLVGSCLWESNEPDQELSNWLNRPEIINDPLIYVQPGRSFQSIRFWEYLIEALGNLPLKIVASVGRMDGELTNIPPNFFIRDHISQGLILPQAKAVICNGHTTSVLGALTHGLPSLLLPNGSGTEDLAERCQKAGAATILTETEINVNNLQTAVETLLETSDLRQNAQRLQKAFRKIDSFETVASLLENLAMQGKS